MLLWAFLSDVHTCKSVSREDSYEWACWAYRPRWARWCCSNKHLRGLRLCLPHAVHPVWVCRGLFSLSALQDGLMVAPFLMPLWAPSYGDSSLMNLMLALGTSTWQWHLFLLFTLHWPKRVTGLCVTSKTWGHAILLCAWKERRAGMFVNSPNAGSQGCAFSLFSIQIASQSDCARSQSGSGV